MEKSVLLWHGRPLPLLTCSAIVIGSGCAGYNAIDRLLARGVDAVLVTDGITRGTSRNAGSDKQTYYKLSLSSRDPDSVYDLAATLAGPDADGDIALRMAASSVRCFLNLVEAGVPFPANEYGEYVGYKTDHDPRARATSAGPLTSRMMTEQLEKRVQARRATVLDHLTVFRLLTVAGRAAGCLALDTEKNDYVCLSAPAILLATGGEAAVYADSVFPLSQHGMTGVALDAGARGMNLHLWQYGLASTAFRWNVSGSYQQVIPRYITETGEEFLSRAIPDPRACAESVFLKGYQWPFDVNKTQGSSRIDLAVHRARHEEGHHTFLDFTRDPACLAAGYPRVAREYLENSSAMATSPIERLRHLNAPAIELYRSHDIDISREMLEVAVCAQHMNGGLLVDARFETNIPGIYCAGEAAGTFGAFRPGGSALNAAQVGSLVAAEEIARKQAIPFARSDDFIRALDEPLTALSATAQDAARFAEDMSRYAAHIRSIPDMERVRLAALSFAPKKLPPVPDPSLASRLLVRDQLIATERILSAMLLSAKEEGSRGSALVVDPTGSGQCRGVLETDENGTSSFRPARPIPEGDQWFERVWRACREKNNS